MWKKYFTLSLLLALLLSASPLFSDVTLTDDEYNEVMNSLIQQEQTLTEQAQKIANLETDLTQASTIQQGLSQTIETQSTLIGDLKTYSDGLRNDPRINLDLGIMYTHDGPGIYAGVSVKLF